MVEIAIIQSKLDQAMMSQRWVLVLTVPLMNQWFWISNQNRSWWCPNHVLPYLLGVHGFPFSQRIASDQRESPSREVMHLLPPYSAQVRKTKGSTPDSRCYYGLFMLQSPHKSGCSSTEIELLLGSSDCPTVFLASFILRVLREPPNNNSMCLNPSFRVCFQENLARHYIFSSSIHLHCYSFGPEPFLSPKGLRFLIRSVLYDSYIKTYITNLLVKYSFLYKMLLLK